MKAAYSWWSVKNLISQDLSMPTYLTCELEWVEQKTTFLQTGQAPGQGAEQIKQENTKCSWVREGHSWVSWVSVEDSWLRVEGSCLRVEGSWLRVEGSWLRVEDSWLRVEASWLRVEGSWLRVEDS